MEVFKIPDEVLLVTTTLEKAGFEAFIVGGCIRDLLLGKTPNDWDITTNAKPQQIEALFQETYYNNIYGTVGVVSHETVDERLKVIEVTPYRTESTYSNHRHPDTVAFGVSLSDDLARRDFTINAIAYRPHTTEFVDNYKGQKDIKDKIIRAVGAPKARFEEDALRILRAIRLGAVLGFAIETDTFAAIIESAPLLAHVSCERVRDELIKIVMSERPMEAFLVMKHCGILFRIIPELEKAVGLEQNHSHKYVVFEHLIRSMQHAADKNWSLEIRLAALFHDIAKPQTRRFSHETSDWTFYGHEVVGSRETVKILKRLRFSEDIVQKVTLLVRWHMFFSDPDQITLSAVRRMIRNVGTENIWDLLNIRICDRVGSGRAKEQPFRFRKYQSMVEEVLHDPISVGMLKIDGKQLLAISHETPGPRIGYVLHALLEEVLDNPSKNNFIQLQSRAKELFLLSTEELMLRGEEGKEKMATEEQQQIKKIRSKYSVT